MKNSEHSPQTIAQALQQANKHSVVQICNQFGITDTTFYNWRQLYAGLDTKGIARLQKIRIEKQQMQRQLKQLQLENQVLHGLVSLALEPATLQSALDPLLKKIPVTERRLKQILGID